MTVHCEGDCRVVEQLGEKQDFEAELSRHGFKHEDFALRVTHQVPEGAKRGARQSRGDDYLVTVVNVATQKQRLYHGGPRQEWVVQCAADLAGGVFGHAAARRA